MANSAKTTNIMSGTLPGAGSDAIAQLSIGGFGMHTPSSRWVPLGQVPHGSVPAVLVRARAGGRSGTRVQLPLRQVSDAASQRRSQQISSKTSQTFDVQSS